MALQLESAVVRALFVAMGSKKDKVAKLNDAQLLGYIEQIPGKVKLGKVKIPDDVAQAKVLEDILNELGSDTGKVQITGGESPTDNGKPTAKKDGKAAAKKGGKAAAAQKGPGVIQTIFETVKKASKSKPVSAEELVKVLKKAFPDRDADGMAKTIAAQLRPGRMGKERGVTINSNDHGYWFSK